MKLSGIKIRVLAKPRWACGSGAAGKPAGIVTQRSHRGPFAPRSDNAVERKAPGSGSLAGTFPGQWPQVGPREDR